MRQSALLLCGAVVLAPGQGETVRYDALFSFLDERPRPGGYDAWPPGQTNTPAAQAQIATALLHHFDHYLAVHYRATAAFGRYRVLERAR